MSIKSRLTGLISILGMLAAITLLASPIARAEQNPFSVSDSASGIILAGEEGKKAKCGEGKCGDSEKKAKCEKCAKGEKCDKCKKAKKAKCGDSKKKAKCGEGKCGDSKKKAKCGEGKCGGKEKSE